MTCSSSPTPASCLPLTRSARWSRRMADSRVGGVSGALVLDVGVGRPARLWRRRGRLLALREVASIARKLYRFDGRRDGSHSCDPAQSLAAAASRHDSRRRAGADASGTGGIPGGLRRTPRARSIRRPRRPPTSSDARAGRWPATTNCSDVRAARLLVPWVNPIWVQFVSHKIGPPARAVRAHRLVGREWCTRRCGLAVRVGLRLPGRLLRPGWLRRGP